MSGRTEEHHDVPESGKQINASRIEAYTKLLLTILILSFHLSYCCACDIFSWRIQPHILVFFLSSLLLSFVTFLDLINIILGEVWNWNSPLSNSLHPSATSPFFEQNVLSEQSDNDTRASTFCHSLQWVSKSKPDTASLCVTIYH